MGYLKYSLLTVVTVAALTSFVACDPNTGANKQIKSGSVVSDGTNVTSQGNIGSIPVNIAITNIGPGQAAYGTGTGNIAAATYGMPVAGPQHFDLLISTSSQNMYGNAAMIAQPASITITPTIYNQAAAQWYGQTSTWATPVYLSSGTAAYTYDSKCSSQACEVLYLNIVVVVNNDAKQIGIKKSMTLNKILAVTEFVGNVQNVHTTDQIITELSNDSSL